MENDKTIKTLGIFSNVLSWITLIVGIILTIFLLSIDFEIQSILSVLISSILGFTILQILGNLILLVLKLHKKIDTLIEENKQPNESQKNLTFEKWQINNPNKTIHDFYREISNS
jgi:xanthine/uracil/vitamin C permease (AzgA family)